jgi:DUF1680 family protein
MWKPVLHTSVTLNDGFWSPRVETNRRVTLPIEYEQYRKTGRLAVWTWQKGQPNPPHIFWDSDVGKWLEAVGYSLGTHPDPRLEKLADQVIDDMANAQPADGYLNSHFLLVEPGKRWSNLTDCHELYCAGHLMEAAVAYARATGKRKVLDVMCRYADCIDRTFGLRKGQLRGYCGHAEIELALVKLFHATGEKRYLNLAKYFVDERGRSPSYFVEEARKRGDLNVHPFKTAAAKNMHRLAHVPVREQTEAVGHAVCAMYLYSAMADVAAETHDTALLAACRRLWKSATQRRMYITGGIGSSRHTERFTCDYDLPNETAYAETCASIGLVFFAHRMLQVEADGAYADVMERALYNGVLSGVSLDGKRFFYANPLAAHPVSYAARPGDDHGYHTDLHRQEWFGCACCPPNIARLLASIGQYVYSQNHAGLFVHLYASGSAELEVGGQRVVVNQRTQYPWQGRVELEVLPTAPGAFTVALRMPGWCRDAKIKVNGKAIRTAGLTRKGYVYLRRVWRTGDRVELVLAMPVERIASRPEVRSNCGKVALQRGPIVFCLEEVDNGRDLADITLPRKSKLAVKWEQNLLGGSMTITGQALRRDRRGWGEALYQPVNGQTTRVTLKAVPYCLWNNRKAGEMVVWVGAAP